MSPTKPASQSRGSGPGDRCGSKRVSCREQQNPEWGHSAWHRFFLKCNFTMWKVCGRHCWLSLLWPILTLFVFLTKPPFGLQVTVLHPLILRRNVPKSEQGTNPNLSKPVTVWKRCRLQPESILIISCCSGTHFPAVWLGWPCDYAPAHSTWP